MKYLMFACVLMCLCGCVKKKTTYDSRGNVKDEKYIIQRPVKNFIENVEVE